MKKENGTVSPELQRRKDEAKRLADKYCSKDGGDPDLAAVAKLSPMDYGAVRTPLADALGIPVKFLDDELKARRHGGDEDALPPDPEPWPDSVAGARLLDELVEAINDHLVLSAGAAETIALWVLLAHVHDCFEVSPVLAMTSPTPECGKTTVLTLVGELVPRPLPAANITGAAFFRAVDKWLPTVLIDEADTFLRDSDELRGILNSGHNRRNAWVVRTQGDNHEPRRFSTWTPKAIALIGKLPPTLSSWSLHIKLQRKLATDTVAPLRADRLTHLLPLHRKAARWSQDSADALRASDPDLPPELQSRIADNWRPLIAIADLAGGKWPDTARRISIAAALVDRDETAGIMLLGDLKVIFDRRRVEQLHSDDIIDDLVEMEERPWAEWRNGKPITKNQLAKLLAGFEVHPKQVWSNSKNKGGYKLETLKPAFTRYLSPRVLDPLAGNELRGFKVLDPDSDPRTLKTLDPLKSKDSRDSRTSRTRSVGRRSLREPQRPISKAPAEGRMARASART